MKNKEALLAILLSISMMPLVASGALFDREIGISNATNINGEVGMSAILPKSIYA